jgi:hypothetical protein
VFLAARGVHYSLSVQLSRSLEIESLGGALFVATHRAFGIPLSKQGHYYDFPGHSAQIIGFVSVGIGISIIAALWIAHARVPASRASLVRYAAATVAGVDRVRQGALTAISPLADPARSARGRKTGARSHGTPRSRLPPDRRRLPT